MAGTEQLKGAIEPGSTEYGDRQVLEQGLSALGQAGAAGAGAPQASLPQTSAGNPLEALMSGDITPQQSQDLPGTAGLSVGPGPGPHGMSTENPRMARLRQVATEARSPELRQVARNELRRLVREKK